jgi:hypothetical protein
MVSQVKAVKIRVGLLVHDPMRLAGLSAICSNLPQLEPVQGELSKLLADLTLRFLVVDLKDARGAQSKNVDLIRRINTARPDLHQIVIGGGRR